MSQLRPKEAFDAGELHVRHEVINPSVTAPKFEIPEVDSTELGSLMKRFTELPEVRDQELREIRDHLEGGKRALTAKYFPNPSSSGKDQWSANKKLLSHINLVQPTVRALVNAVYAEEPARAIVDNPFKEEMEDWIESEDYSEACYRWAWNKVAFGTAVAVPRYDDREKWVWLPDPVHTHIFQSDEDSRHIVAVAEVRPGRIEFVAKWGEGVLREKGSVVEIYEAEADWLPAVVGHGSLSADQRSPYGIPMVRDAISATYAATMVMFNTRLLQKQQTRSLLTRIGNLETLPSLESVMSADTGSVDGPEGSRIDYISPKPEIQGSLDVLKGQVSLLATASGVPADVLDPTLTESASSAEGSRIRAIPLIQNSKPLVRRWRGDERKLVLAMTYVRDRTDDGEWRSYKDLKPLIKTEIALQTAIIPQTPNEETQDVIARMTSRLMTPEDAVRKLNGNKSKSQVVAMADEIRRGMEEDGARALEQKAIGGGRPKELSGAGGTV